MANTDSFIDEVSEEVRRDRLFALFRRWAWLAILIVVLLVGGAAYLEWQRAQNQASAEAFGNAVLTALDNDSPEARIAALEAVEAPGDEAALVVALLAAGEASANDGTAADAAAGLRAAAMAPELPQIYRDLAIYKAHLLSPLPADEARLELGILAEPGRPFAALAEEQLALIDVVEGDIEAAINRLRSLENAAAATPGLQQRAAQLIVALEAGATLVDTAPVEEEPPVVEPAPEAPAEDAETGTGEAADAGAEDAVPEGEDDGGDAAGDAVADEETEAVVEQ